MAIPVAAEHREERLAISRMFVDISREIRTAVFGDQADGDDMTGVLVACAVGIGTFEGRPMTATKLALYVDLPRTTVLRKLDRLCDINVVRKVGRIYVLSTSRIQTFPQDRRERYYKIIFSTCELLRSKGHQ